MKNINSILLLGTENILALSVIRSLGSVLPDVNIHTFSPLDKNKSVSERSKYITSSHYFNSWDDDYFLFRLKNRIEETGADIVIPISDQSVRVLASLKESLQDVVYLPPLPSPETYDRLEEKDKLPELLSLLKIPQAQTWTLNPDKKNVPDDEHFPLLLKPKNGSSGNGIKKARTAGELAEITKDMDADEFILQEIIPGQDYGCSLLAVDGEIKAYTIQKVLVNKGFGVATAIKFLNNDAIFTLTKQLIKDTGYSGLAHLDFRLDERDGLPKLLDFNARFWFSLLGSKAAGVDFALLNCLAATGTAFKQPDYSNITYFLGSNTVRYYLRNMFNFRKQFEATKTVYTDLWDRIGDPIPEVARYIR